MWLKGPRHHRPQALGGVRPHENVGGRLARRIRVDRLQQRLLVHGPAAALLERSAVHLGAADVQQEGVRRVGLEGLEQVQGAVQVDGEGGARIPRRLGHRRHRGQVNDVRRARLRHRAIHAGGIGDVDAAHVAGAAERGDLGLRPARAGGRDQAAADEAGGACHQEAHGLRLRPGRS